MWDQERVERIAWASRRVDKHELTQPFTPIDWSLRFHFPDERGSGTRVGGANLLVARIAGASLNRGEPFLGIAVHLLADTYSHAGYTWRHDVSINSHKAHPLLGYFPVAKGHARASDFPDNMKVWSDEAAAAAVACYELIYEYASIRGIAKARYDPEELREALVRMFMTLPDEKEFWAPALREAFRSWGVDVPQDFRGLNWLHEADYAAYTEAEHEVGEIFSAAVTEHAMLRDRARREALIRRVMTPLAVWTMMKR